MSVTLYQLDGCPFCEKVADRLDEIGVDYETIWVDAMHSDRDEVKRVSGQRGVPVLVDDDRGVTMPESENILEFVDRTYAAEA
jgi:glutaredoxin